jgi:hypothetical protein
MVACGAPHGLNRSPRVAAAHLEASGATPMRINRKLSF